MPFFLGSGFLVAAAAVIVPIALHLLQRRRPRPVMFGTLRFLRDAIAQSRRAHRITQGLTLLMRILIILLLAAAFARPLLRRSGLIPAGRRTVVMIVDCSASMQTLEGGRNYFDHARSWAVALTDSLQDGESYFIVEIKSLRRILEASEDSRPGTARTGTETCNPVLCCIDEVLRGTNTVERIAASAEILRCFAKTKTLCFAATHDLELTGLLGDVYDNYHFSEEIVDGDVRFSYRIMPGPSTSCNAIALLNALGYDKSIVEQARARADRFLADGTWQQSI